MKKSKISNTPLTFDIREDLLKKVNSFKAKSRARSVSEVIRYALDNFSFTKFKPEIKNHKQISVRIPEDMRVALAQNAKTKNVSLGELLRAALEDLPLVPKKSLAPPPAPKKVEAKKPAPKAAAKPAPKPVAKASPKPAAKTVAKAPTPKAKKPAVLAKKKKHTLAPSW